MSRWTKIALAVVVFSLSNISAFAMPEFLQMFLNDPFHNPSFMGCTTCHMSPEGGDARNTFGQAFESGGEVITTMLRAQFPDHFNYPVSRVSDALTIRFSDPANKEAVVESGATRTLVSIENKTVDGRPAVVPGAPPTAASAAATPQISEIRTDPYAHEGVFFGGSVVNLPNGKPMRRGGWEFFIGHRFTQDVANAHVAGLFGFDSSAIVAYGVRAALTDRITFGVARSNLDKEMSLTSTFQVSRQSAEFPLTIQIRGGVDGRRNFGMYQKEHFPFKRQYSPFIQPVFVRTFKERVSLLAAPTFAFNTRNEETFTLPEFVFGSEHNDSISLGLGAGVRVLSSVSIVGEFIPRLHGFRGEVKDRPGVSIGLQKSTFRHTFELLISRQQALTPVADAFQGNDLFRIGFNIYRRLK